MYFLHVQSFCAWPFNEEVCVMALQLSVCLLVIWKGINTESLYSHFRIIDQILVCQKVHWERKKTQDLVRTGSGTQSTTGLFIDYRSSRFFQYFLYIETVLKSTHNNLGWFVFHFIIWIKWNTKTQILISEDTKCTAACKPKQNLVGFVLFFLVQTGVTQEQKYSFQKAQIAHERSGFATNCTEINTKFRLVFSWSNRK